MNGYAVVLFAHSYVRWALVALVAVVLVRALLGWRGARVWARADERLHVALVACANLQFTLGVVLYLFLSPFSHAFFDDPAVAVKVAALRFFGLEHPVMMLIAVALVHIGRARSRKAATDALRHRRVFATTLAALVVLCLALPWPFTDYGRPWLRGFAGGAAPHLAHHQR
jgi:Na+-driven multidrug efflux pump